MNTGVLLLAAGRSLRFGADKRLAVLADGRTLLEATVSAVEGSGLPLRVCLSDLDGELGATLERRGLTVIYCSDAAQGMGATLAQGMVSIPDWGGVVIALADMPLVRLETYRALADKLTPASICVPTWGGTRGNPVAFGSDYYTALRQMRGDTGARILLQRDPDAVREMPVKDPGVLTDVDSQADLTAIAAQKAVFK